MSSRKIELRSHLIDETSEKFSFNCPSWASKPPPSCGLYFDVVKDNSVISKLLIDDKAYYLIGRHAKQCDFILNHASVSRVHASVIYHKNLKRLFVMDLGSTHGTFIGSLRLESHKPQVLPIDTTIYFGQSTRCYTLRERMSNASHSDIISNNEHTNQLQVDSHYDDLTQYNTALNRQLINFNIATPSKRSSKCCSKRISFSTCPDEIINLEDVDPSIGRFRNMVQSSFIPSAKRYCQSSNEFLSLHEKCDLISEIPENLYSEINVLLPPKENQSNNSASICAAPKVEDPSLINPLQPVSFNGISGDQSSVENLNHVFDGLPKKKYAKEAWPGKKAATEKSTNLLIS